MTSCNFINFSWFPVLCSESGMMTFVVFIYILLISDALRPSLAVSLKLVILFKDTCSLAHQLHQGFPDSLKKGIATTLAAAMCSSRTTTSRLKSQQKLSPLLSLYCFDPHRKRWEPLAITIFHTQSLAFPHLPFIFPSAIEYHSRTNIFNWNSSHKLKLINWSANSSF